MKVLLLLLLASSVLTCTLAFAPSPMSKILQPSADADTTTVLFMLSSDTDDEGVCHRRDLLLRTGSFVVASMFGLDGVEPAEAIPEQKVYSSNAKNFQRLGEGDSSGGSVYDNNPTSPKARARRAMVGCKNNSARSLAGESIGNTRLSEKDCNQLVMKGDSGFMLETLTKLDCPSCPYGIGER
uniref:Uncharacterized protein n=1 Tax=Skeletonema marinoi TaxID=267567 RepID=A0A7S2PTR9_9STRA|mmetsp:Transcript_31691/g.53649  ORF Transcript_31691/g.53649 Transcript_31691/m.53649 type:complete len:183 (+) Transcript_31691:39-587(+)